MKLTYPSGARPDRRGSAIVMAMVAVFLVFGLCMGLVQLSRSAGQRQKVAADQKQAFYLSEAGLAEAYAGLGVGHTGNVGTPAAPATIGNGLFWVEATELGPGIVQLESTALYGTGRVSLGLVAERQRINLSSLGVFSNQVFTTNPNSFIDSYDSALGSYGEQVAAGTNDQAHVGSNGNVVVAGGTELRGDVEYGAGGGLTLMSGATLTGAASERPAALPLPAVEVPAMISDPPVLVDSVEPWVLPPGEHAFEELRIRGGSQAIISGPATLVLGSLAASSNSTLTFDNRDGPIDMFVTDEVNLGSGSVAATLSDDPNMVSLQIAAQGSGKVLLGASALFYGQIYSPQASVKVLPSFELFGSLVADEIDISAAGRLHQDLNTSPTRQDVLPSMWAWRVVDIPDAVAGRGGDPFRLLGVDKSVLPAPAAAHEDQRLVVSYLDLAGALQAYDGMESAFDWTQVSRVISGTRDGSDFQPIPGESATAAPGAVPLSPAEQLLVDDIKSPMTSAALGTKLQAEAPGLTEAVLIEAINRVPMMDSWDLYYVLLKNGPYSPSYNGALGSAPLPERTLLAAVQLAGFDSKALSWVLEQNSPLPPAVLDGAINRSPAMKASDLNLVLRAQ